MKQISMLYKFLHKLLQPLQLYQIQSNILFLMINIQLIPHSIDQAIHLQGTLHSNHFTIAIIVVNQDIWSCDVLHQEVVYPHKCHGERKILMTKWSLHLLCVQTIHEVFYQIHYPLLIQKSIKTNPTLSNWQNKRRIYNRNLLGGLWAFLCKS